MSVKGVKKLVFLLPIGATSPFIPMTRHINSKKLDRIQAEVHSDLKLTINSADYMTMYCYFSFHTTRIIIT